MAVTDWHSVRFEDWLRFKAIAPEKVSKERATAGNDLKRMCLAARMLNPGVAAKDIPPTEIAAARVFMATTPLSPLPFAHHQGFTWPSDLDNITVAQWVGLEAAYATYDTNTLMHVPVALAAIADGAPDFGNKSPAKAATEMERLIKLVTDMPVTAGLYLMQLLDKLEAFRETYPGVYAPVPSSGKSGKTAAAQRLRSSYPWPIHVLFQVEGTTRYTDLLTALAENAHSYLNFASYRLQELAMQQAESEAAAK